MVVSEFLIWSWASQSCLTTLFQLRTSLKVIGRPRLGETIWVDNKWNIPKFALFIRLVVVSLQSHHGRRLSRLFRCRCLCVCCALGVCVCARVSPLHSACLTRFPNSPRIDRAHHTASGYVATMASHYHHHHNMTRSARSYHARRYTLATLSLAAPAGASPPSLASHENTRLSPFRDIDYNNPKSHARASTGSMAIDPVATDEKKDIDAGINSTPPPPPPPPTPPLTASANGGDEESQDGYPKKPPYWRRLIINTTFQMIVAALLAVTIGLTVAATVEKVPEEAKEFLVLPGYMWLRAVKAVGTFFSSFLPPFRGRKKKKRERKPTICALLADTIQMRSISPQ